MVNVLLLVLEVPEVSLQVTLETNDLHEHQSFQGHSLVLPSARNGAGFASPEFDSWLLPE